MLHNWQDDHATHTDTTKRCAAFVCALPGFAHEMQETLRTQGSKEVTRNREEPLEPQGKQGTIWCQHSLPGSKGSRVHYGASTALQAPREAGYIMVPAQPFRPQGKQGTLRCQQKALGIVRAFGRAWNSQKRAIPGMRAGPLGAHFRRGSRNARREAGGALRSKWKTPPDVPPTYTTPGGCGDPCR